MPDPKIPAGKKRRRGVSGTRFSFGKIINHERNWNLRGDAWVEMTQKMLTDAIVRSARDARRQSLLSATWEVVSAKPGDALADKYANFVAENFGLNDYASMLSSPWEEQMASFFLFEDVGYRYFEEMWRLDPDGFVRLDHWADRMPSAHYKWLRTNGVLSGVQQKDISEDHGFAYMGVAGPIIPADKLLLLTRDREGDNYEGTGTLRACQFEWQLSFEGLTLLGVAVEKWALSTPKVSYNRQEIFNDLKGSGSELGVDDVLDDLEATLKSYMAQDEAVLMVPTGVTVEPFGSGQMNLDGFKGVDDLITRRIQYAYLVQFLSLGQGATGARSVGETQISFFDEAAANSLDYVAGRIGGFGRPGAGTIGRLLSYNFGKVPADLLPRLRHKGLKTAPLAQALGDLGILLQNNALHDTDQLEAQLLDVFDAGPLTDQSRDLRKARHDYIINEEQMADAGPTTEPTR